MDLMLNDNFLALMKDVRVGSGNIWNDMDIANAKFDNVSVYNVALSDKQVEALYNDETKENEVAYPKDSIIKNTEVFKDLGDYIKVYDDLWLEIKSK